MLKSIVVMISLLLFCTSALAQPDDAAWHAVTGKLVLVRLNSGAFWLLFPKPRTLWRISVSS